jgi:peptidoglycan/LPS O-acetylase OafA/YrhL
MTSSTSPVRPQRFLFIDGLRGVAAMMVVFRHLHENLEPSVEAWFPDLLGFLFSWGNLGVEVFFVLSGFVIAHSVRNGLHTWRYLGRFALRRSIRLDPALWLTIVAELGVILLTLRFFPAYSPELPSAAKVIANATYTQHFFGLGDVVPVFWTLTYEVQFYLALVLSLVLWNTWGPGRRVRADAAAPGPDAPAARGGAPAPLGTVPRIILLASCVYSASIQVGLLPLPLQGLFFDRWYQFAAGTAVWLWVRGRMPLPWLLPWFALLLAAAWMAPNPLLRMANAVIFVTAAALALAGAADRYHSWLAGPVWQFLGRISYSLYLIHATVGWRFVSLVRDRLGPELGVVTGSFAFLGGLALSIGCAWVMHRLIEGPTMRLARRVSLPSRRPGSTGSPSGFASSAAAPS